MSLKLQVPLGDVEIRPAYSAVGDANPDFISMWHRHGHVCQGQWVGLEWTLMLQYPGFHGCLLYDHCCFVSFQMDLIPLAPQGLKHLWDIFKDLI